MNPYIKVCLQLFLFTRIFFIFIITIVYSTNLVSKYDLSTDLLSISEISDEPISSFEKKISNFLSYFSSYDAIHFILISKNNYFNDNIFAFFPLFPWLIRGFARFFELILPFESEFIPFMLSGFILSNLLCFANCLLIFIIIFNITNSFKRAKICVFLFLINPGTIFYISIYSENLYLMLQLIFIHFVIKSGQEQYEELNSKILGNITEKKPTFFLQIASIIIGLLMTRSNSLFLCTYFAVPVLIILFFKEKYVHSYNFFNFYYNFCQFIKIYKKVFKEVGLYVVLCFHAALCFIFMTKYKPKWSICYHIKKGINKGLTKYDLFYKWCTHDKDNEIHSFYSYIQKEYWNVGFLNQYSINTIDRIALALPMNILSLYVLNKLYHYFNFPELISEFNLGKFFVTNTIYEDKILLHHDEHDKHDLHAHSKNFYRNSITSNAVILGGGLNYLFNFLVLVFMAHPQINNRLLSSCPILYLAISRDVIDFLENNRKGNYYEGFAILFFFITFALLGCIMQVGAYGFA